MNDETYQLLLRLVVQMTIAPHAVKDSDAWKDALDFLDPDEVEEELIEAASHDPFFGEED